MKVRRVIILAAATAAVFGLLHLWFAVHLGWDTWLVMMGLAGSVLAGTMVVRYISLARAWLMVALTTAVNYAFSLPAGDVKTATTAMVFVALVAGIGSIGVLVDLMLEESAKYKARRASADG